MLYLLHFFKSFLITESLIFEKSLLVSYLAQNNNIFKSTSLGPGRWYRRSVPCTLLTQFNPDTQHSPQNPVRVISEQPGSANCKTSTLPTYLSSSINLHFSNNKKLVFLSVPFLFSNIKSISWTGTIFSM